MLSENGDAYTEVTIECWTIFGDVSLQLRTDTPSLIDNSATTLLMANYSTTITSDGSPVEGARVTLYQDGTNYTGTTNSSGYVSIDHDFEVGTDVTVTVTAYNCETEQSVMMVTGDIGGDFSIDHSSLDFGYVTVNGSLAMQFTITNDHNSEVIIGEISTPANFSVANASKDTKNTMSYAVLENSSKTFDLFFEPTAQTSYSGNVVITSSDTSHPTTNISVSGAGSYPDINLASDTGATATPGGTIGDSFDIQNTGQAGLNYSLSNEYVGALIPGGTYHSNDFTVFPGTGYTSSNFSSNSGGAYVTATNTTVTGILTSGYFSTTAAGGTVYLDFDQTFNVLANGASTTVEYYNGTSWSTVYTNTLTTSSPAHIALPGTSANAQLRFTGVMTKGQGSSARSNWLIDNIVVWAENIPYTWLTFNSATTGLVAGSGSNTINLTYNSDGMSEGVYESDITVSSDDPDEPSEVIHVTFTVSSGSAPEPPANTTVVTATASEVNLGWDAVTGATLYNIYRSTDPYSGFTKIGTSGTNSYQDTGVSAGNKYFYYITTEN